MTKAALLWYLKDIGCRLSTKISHKCQFGETMAGNWDRLDQYALETLIIFFCMRYVHLLNVHCYMCDILMLKY